MDIVEKIWSFLGLVIIFLILLTDPKTLTNTNSYKSLLTAILTLVSNLKYDIVVSRIKSFHCLNNVLYHLISLVQIEIFSVSIF